MRSARRGVPIGAYTSQPIGNVAASAIDQHMKEVGGVKGYLRECDDVVGLSLSMSQARRELAEFERKSMMAGLTIKANAVVSVIGTERRRDRRRKRMRGRKRKKD